MTQTMQILRDEHRRIRSMLSCFEAQVERFERAERPDYEILEGSIAYCQEYLDRWHHVRENALLELLKVRAPAKAQACADLEDQHLDLARTTGELVQLFEAVERGAEYPREHLVEKSQMLVRDYCDHLDWEEASFFPAVIDHLLPEDWQAVTRRFADTADPLASNPVDQRYQALFRAIEAS